MTGDDEFPAHRALGWCGCGAPTVAEEAIYNHLRRIVLWRRLDHGDGKQSRVCGDLFGLARGADRGPGSLYDALYPDDAEFWLCAYVCDRAGWTEHGGGVGASWLTASGEAMLRQLDDLYGDGDLFALAEEQGAWP